MIRLFGDYSLGDHVEERCRIEWILRRGVKEAAGYFQVQLLLFFKRDQSQNIGRQRLVETGEEERSLY